MDIAKLLEMLRNPAALQAQALALQQKMKAIRVTGQSGGGMVCLTLTGDMEMVECTIAPEAVAMNDPKLLQDLILAAYHDASQGIKETIQKEMTGSLGDFGGFPFGGFPGLDRD
ncbi:MAG: YbaB/EbfC family nucleoid-associated protein [Rectinemataceae bacterium]|nr:YbaB/EbfC family nucleoid-associated protein [Spirochaetaceae bacterium]